LPLLILLWCVMLFWAVPPVPLDTAKFHWRDCPDQFKARLRGSPNLGRWAKLWWPVSRNTAKTNSWIKLRAKYNCIWDQAAESEQQIYLLKEIIKKKQEICKKDGQEDLFETSDWQLCLKSANLDFSTAPPNLIRCRAGP
jgi:hypothetical protein